MENDFGQIINYISEGGIGEGFFVTYAHACVRAYVCVCVQCLVYFSPCISKIIFTRISGE